MNKALIEKILLIPHKFYTTKNVSYYSLLKDSGYFEHHKEVTETGISIQLRIHPEWCKQWFQWSEDQRSDSGWYILKKDENTYIVGYYSPQKKITPKEFTDLIQALSYYIKNQIEYSRSNSLC